MQYVAIERAEPSDPHFVLYGDGAVVPDQLDVDGVERVEQVVSLERLRLDVLGYDTVCRRALWREAVDCAAAR